jgi:4a-hydroxytetrahydrobiopterin dehydratase
VTEQITPRQFHGADGVEDWRCCSGRACAHFRTASFAAGVALVDAIGTLAGAANRAAAHELNVSADPTAVQIVQVSIDALVGLEVLPFWRAVLGYEQFGDEDLLDAHGRGPSFWFQQLDAPRPKRNRIHVDISVPHDQAEARIAAAIAAGGRLGHRPVPAGVDAGRRRGQRGRRGHLDGPRLRAAFK